MLPGHISVYTQYSCILLTNKRQLVITVDIFPVAEAVIHYCHAILIAVTVFGLPGSPFGKNGV